MKNAMLRTLAAMSLSTATIGAVQAQPPHTPAMATIGAEASGYNYENAAVCNAPADLLSAYKARSHALFAAAGPQFEPAFAKGRADANASWKDTVMRLGDARARSICVDGHVVNDLRAELAKH